jgi:tRNA pseudouridine38-40 synthase
MVRAIVGAMIDIARHKRTSDEISTVLKNPNRDLASPFAPAVGLDLFRIYYKKPFEFIR